MQEGKIKYFQIKNKKLIDSLFIGNFKAAFSGRGIEFQDFRQYTPGDDAKYIDWATSSREGTTVIRRYRQEKQAAILCVLDVSESLKFGGEMIKIELMQNIVTLLTYASFGSGSAMGGYILGDNDSIYIPPKRDKTVLYKLLRQDSIRPRGTKETLSLQEILKSKMKKQIIFVISDSLDIDKRSFSIAALKHDIVYVHISSHFENTLSGSGISLLKGKKIFGINLDSQDKKKLYAEKRKMKLDNFSKELKKINIDSVFLNEKSNVFSEFLKLMKSREK